MTIIWLLGTFAYFVWLCSRYLDWEELLVYLLVSILWPIMLVWWAVLWVTVLFKRSL